MAIPEFLEIPHSCVPALGPLHTSFLLPETLSLSPPLLCCQPSLTDLHPTVHSGLGPDTCLQRHLDQFVGFCDGPSCPQEWLLLEGGLCQLQSPSFGTGLQFYFLNQLRTPALVLSDHWGKTPHLSGPQFPHLLAGGKMYLPHGIVLRINQVKGIAWCGYMAGAQNH